MNIEETNMMIIGGKNTDLQRLTRVTETSPFGRNRAIPLNQGGKLPTSLGLTSPVNYKVFGNFDFEIRWRYMKVAG